MSRTSKRIIPITLTAAMLVIPVAGWVFRQDIFDWSRLRAYTPTSEVEQLATRTTMNDYGRRLFYVYHPSLESKQTFNQHCTESEQTIVLGCYVSGRGIYVYDITDSRLAGIEEVTAAHEMLHAAYERLKPQEKQRINSMLNRALGNVKNERILSTVEQYRQKDPSIVVNELHSILGTEVEELPAELEAYYKRYFSDRSKIVALSQQYERAFSDRRDKVDGIDARLRQLKTQIDNLEKQLESQSKALSAERARMDALLKQDRVEAYNNAVPGYNADVSAYNVNVATAKSLIEQYNALVSERNNLVLEENELIKAIDSRPTPLNSQ